MVLPAITFLHKYINMVRAGARVRASVAIGFQLALVIIKKLSDAFLLRYNVARLVGPPKMYTFNYKVVISLPLEGSSQFKIYSHRIVTKF